MTTEHLEPCRAICAELEEAQLTLLADEAKADTEPALTTAELIKELGWHDGAREVTNQ